MTFGFAILTVGALMLLAGSRNESIIDVLKGQLGGKPGPGDKGFTANLVSTTLSVPGMAAGALGGLATGNPSVAKGIAAANKIAGKYPYSWGGGHGKCCEPGGEGENGGPGFDCSGAVSCVLCAMGVLSSPLTSGGLATWGQPGPGKIVTVYANEVHTFMKIGGAWFGTGSAKEAIRGGPAWGNHDTTAGYSVRHPKGM